MGGKYQNRRIYEIFVSTTTVDLRPHRRKAADNILRLGHRPITMEAFSAYADESEDFLKQTVSACDVFVVILGNTIGSEIHSGLSYIEFELEVAREQGKPILAFVLDDDEVRRLSPAPEVGRLREKLLLPTRIRSFFKLDDVSGLGEQIYDAVNHLTRELENNESGGWVRSTPLTDAADPTTIPHAIIASPALRQLIGPLSNIDELVPNLDQDPDLKSAIGSFACENIGHALTRESGIRRLFIDGGSTTFYFCRALNEYFYKNAIFFHRKTFKHLTVSTNSVINFIELTMNQTTQISPYQSVRMYPGAPIHKVYGKSFGSLMNVEPETTACMEDANWVLSENARKHIDVAVKQFVAWQSAHGGLNLSVISAAGLNVTGTRQGPWVKSYYSMLLQQGVFRSKLPVLLLLDGRKWNVEPPERAFRVLFDDLAWESVLSSQPIAIAVASEDRARMGEIKKYFSDRNFRVPDDTQENLLSRDINCMFAYNDGFRDLALRPHLPTKQKAQ